MKPNKRRLKKISASALVFRYILGRDELKICKKFIRKKINITMHKITKLINPLQIYFILFLYEDSKIKIKVTKRKIKRAKSMAKDVFGRFNHFKFFILSMTIQSDSAKCMKLKDEIILSTFPKIGRKPHFQQ